mgnify:CR=1 FL=1
MRIIKVKNYDEVSVKTANLILGQVNLKPDAVLGLATGGSPVGAYKKIVEAYNNGEVDFSGVTTINLDEYRRNQKKPRTELLEFYAGKSV